MESGSVETGPLAVWFGVVLSLLKMAKPQPALVCLVACCAEPEPSVKMLAVHGGIGVRGAAV